MSEFAGARRLNHVAYVTRDTGATVRFYTEIMQMPLVGHAEADSVGSTGESTHFLHTFFKLRDGSAIAFFDIEGLPEETRESVVPRWAQHLAMSVDSEAELDDAHKRLVDHGVEVTGPVDHEGIWKSIYFFDPNGVRLELTYQNRPLDESDARAAVAAAAQWASTHA